MRHEKSYCIKCRNELKIEKDGAGRTVLVKCPKHGVIYKRKGVEMQKNRKADIQKVREYFALHHYGVDNIAPRHEIYTHLNMSDRHFRNVCAKIPEIISTVHKEIYVLKGGICFPVRLKSPGYYMIPAVDYEGYEAAIAAAITNGEGGHRLIALYRRQKAQKRIIRRLKLSGRDESVRAGEKQTMMSF